MQSVDLMLFVLHARKCSPSAITLCSCFLAAQATEAKKLDITQHSVQPSLNINLRLENDLPMNAAVGC